VFLNNGDGETNVELIEDLDNEYMRQGISMGFQVSEVENYREELIAKGYKASPIIAPNPKTKFFFVKDPNGVDIQFIN
ncbi:MAG: VOC family protein, partial [Bacillota bacterium]|nr:VOC family protein [Bacillota bacterium]